MMNRSEVHSDVEELLELAHDIGSNVVIPTCTDGSQTVMVDGLVFNSAADAIRHCREVA